MSFGRPSTTILSSGGAPPARGSFPLDHEGAFLFSLPVLSNSLTFFRFDRRVQGRDDGLPEVYENGKAAVDRLPASE
jgi:hypothetical protein